MKGKLVIGLAIVIAGALGWWFFPKGTPTISRNTAALTSAGKSRPAETISGATQPASEEPGRHLYSPLSDPPPASTPDQLETWSASLNAILLRGMMPDFSGPRLADIFDETASKAGNGNKKAAMTLFKGLLYCASTPIKSQNDVDNKIKLMTDTYTDADGNQSDDLNAAIATVNQRYRYCSGITEDQSKSMSHWGWIAASSGDPVAQAWAAAYAPPPSAYDSATIEKYRKQLRDMINTAADAGVPEAWVELEQGYLTGAYGYQVDPVKAYASLYTEYMLTNSDYLAYQIWKQSQGLSPQQIQQGEQLAQEFYGKINRQ